MSRRTPETSLYPAVKAHLEELGFEAKGEVLGCDVVGVRAGNTPCLVIAELKAGLSLDLILQGVDRAAACDEVWLAVRATRRGRDRDQRAHRLCRMLGFGLLAVTPSTGRVEVLVHPSLYRPRPDVKRRASLLREHSRRQGDPTPGGAARQPVMTAYRQAALRCGEALRNGPRRVRDLAALEPDAPRILLRNVYGWFERIQRGTYGLTLSGITAISGGEPAVRNATLLERLTASRT